MWILGLTVIKFNKVDGISVFEQISVYESIHSSVFTMTKNMIVGPWDFSLRSTCIVWFEGIVFYFTGIVPGRGVMIEGGFCVYGFHVPVR